MAYTPGPFDSEHLYVQWGGKLPGNEEWSCGLRLYNAAGGTLTPDPTFNNAVSTALQNYHTRDTSSIAGACKLSFVKVNIIGVDGHYREATTQEITLPDVAGGGINVPPHPNQIALAISLLTGFSRGPAHRGRFFMPLPTFTTNLDGLIGASQQANAKYSADLLLSDLNAISANLQVGVFSRKLGSAGHRKVTTTFVGRVLDTQRRRRRSLAEDPAS